MYTQTLYELSQEAERLLQLSRQQLQLLEKMPLSVPGDDAPQLALTWSQPMHKRTHIFIYFQHIGQMLNIAITQALL